MIWTWSPTPGCVGGGVCRRGWCRRGWGSTQCSTRRCGWRAGLVVPPGAQGPHVGPRHGRRGDANDHADVLRAGGSQAVFAHRVKAPSTLGTFLQAFTFGHVRQLEAVTAEIIHDRLCRKRRTRDHR